MNWQSKEAVVAYFETNQRLFLGHERT